jgi:glutaredoxin
MNHKLAKSKTILLRAAALVIVLCAGFYLGPFANAGFHRIFPDKEFVEGDYWNIYLDAKTDIVIFTTSTCPYCRDARRLLEVEGVDFVDYVTDESDDAKRRFRATGDEAVPTIYIGKRKISGFSETAIRQALAARG